MKLLLQIEKADQVAVERECDYTSGFWHSHDDHESKAIVCKDGKLCFREPERRAKDLVGNKDGACPKCKGSGSSRVMCVGGVEVDIDRDGELHTVPFERDGGYLSYEQPSAGALAQNIIYAFANNALPAELMADVNDDKDWRLRVVEVVG